jgi:anti-sigma-K factor RskA
MSNNPNIRESERLAELLADEAAAALTSGEREELNQLAQAAPVAEREAFLRTASLVQIRCLSQDPRAVGHMPERLRARLAEQGQAAVARQRIAPVADIGTAREKRRPSAAAATPITASTSPGRASSIAGWAVAAGLAVAVVGLLNAGPDSNPAVGLPARAELLTRSDALRATFAPSDARYRDVTGDVVWSDRDQAGYLRLAGLPANDPGKAQYQLWIIDPERDRHPVDGGVFNVTSSGEVVIPVQARLTVDRPTTFAITLEKPGGVVVSAGPLLVVAAVST